MATQGFRLGGDDGARVALRVARGEFNRALQERRMDDAAPLNARQLTAARHFSAAAADELRDNGVSVRQDEFDVFINPHTGPAKEVPLISRAAAAAENRLQARVALQTRQHLLAPHADALFHPSLNILDPGLDVLHTGRLPESFNHERGHALTEKLRRDGKFSPFHGGYRSQWRAQTGLPASYERSASADEVEQFTRSLSWLARHLRPGIHEAYAAKARRDLRGRNAQALGPLARAFAKMSGDAAQRVGDGARYQHHTENGRSTVTVKLEDGLLISAELPARTGRFSSKPRREDVVQAFQRRAEINGEIARRSEELEKVLDSGSREDVRSAVRDLRRYTARASRQYVEALSPKK